MRDRSSRRLDAARQIFEGTGRRQDGTHEVGLEIPLNKSVDYALMEMMGYIEKYESNLLALRRG